MKIECDRCGYLIDRDKYLNGQLVEEYMNIYGTRCPKCGFFIKSLKKPFVDEEKELQMEILRNKMKEKLRKTYKEKNKCP